MKRAEVATICMTLCIRIRNSHFHNMDIHLQGKRFPPPTFFTHPTNFPLYMLIDKFVKDYKRNLENLYNFSFPLFVSLCKGKPQKKLF